MLATTGVGRDPCDARGLVAIAGRRKTPGRHGWFAARADSSAATYNARGQEPSGHSGCSETPAAATTTPAKGGLEMSPATTRATIASRTRSTDRRNPDTGRPRGRSKPAPGVGRGSKENPNPRGLDKRCRDGPNSRVGCAGEISGRWRGSVQTGSRTVQGAAGVFGFRRHVGIISRNRRMEPATAEPDPAASSYHSDTWAMPTRPSVATTVSPSWGRFSNTALISLQ